MLLNGDIKCNDNCWSDVDYRELVVQKKSTEPSHATECRPGPDNIRQNYYLDTSLLAGCRNKIIIFDDVLTTGSHFKAMKKLLTEYLPKAEIRGLFVARTTREADLINQFEEQ